MSATLTFTILLATGCLVAYVAARRGDRLVLVLDRSLSLREQKRALLLAMTDEEYEAYELTLLPEERARRVTRSAQWSHLPRRRAMLAYVSSVTDEEYDKLTPAAERARRLARTVVHCPPQGRAA